MFPISDSIKTRHFPILNILIIAATIAVFVKELFAPNPDQFIQAYALIPSQVNLLNFSTFTPFVTAIFLHGGFLHIISNLWFLWVFGDNVEDRLGFIFFPLLYFGSGVLGNVVQYILMPASPIPMLGASGAIAGILGAYYVFYPYSKIKTFVIIILFFTVIDIPASLMLGYWFVLQIIAGASSLPFSGDQGGIAFFAHIGGFLTGVLFAKIYTGLVHNQGYSLTSNN